MQQRLAAQDGSLNRPVGDDGGTTQLQDLLEDPDANVERDVSARLDAHAFWIRMAGHLNQLSTREQEIIIETYVSDTPKTLRVLGERFGVSRERIRQIRESALARLRASLMEATAQ
jgi:RNA polymerase sigma-32 factor